MNTPGINAKNLIKNAVKCLKCNDIIESKHVHDFRYCSCRNIAVDGGTEYTRRIGNITGGTWEELSEYADA